MSYRLLTKGVLRLSDNLVITRDMIEWAGYRTFIKGGGIPEPMDVVVPPELSLNEVKQRKASALTAEALGQVQAILPEVANMATAMLIRELWLSIAPAARSPTAKMGQVIAVYQDWGVAIDAVRACTDVACVNAVTL